MIVPVTAVVVPTVYPVPVARVRTTVSSNSTVLSAVGSIVRLAVAEPAAKTIVLPVPGMAPLKSEVFAVPAML
jgi:hypothetical protein